MNQNLPPQAVLMQMLNGKHISRCISLVAELGITNLLSDGGKTVGQLAESTDSNEDALYRVLRLLSRLGIYAEPEEGVFENNALSELLGDRHSQSLQKYAQWVGTGLHWNVMRDLDFSVKTGKPSILKEHPDKSNAFEVLMANPREQEIFQNAMTGLSLAEGYALLEAYDWTSHKDIADVGGGFGTLAQIVAQNAPGSQVVVFDLPHVIEQTGKIVAASGLPNLKTLSGSFMAAGALPKADLFVMKYIIHDWPDDQSAAILSNCKSSLKENGKIILCEMMITDGPESMPAQIFDIEMLMGPGGKERTQKQFEHLFDSAGLKLNRVIDTKTPLKIIEAMPK